MKHILVENINNVEYAYVPHKIQNSLIVASESTILHHRNLHLRHKTRVASSFQYRFHVPLALMPVEYNAWIKYYSTVTSNSVYCAKTTARVELLR